MKQNEEFFLRRGFKSQPKATRLVQEFEKKIRKNITDFLEKCWGSIFDEHEKFLDDFTGGWNDHHPGKNKIEYFMRRQKNFSSKEGRPWRLNSGFLWMSNSYDDVHNDFADSDNEWPKIYIYYKIKGTGADYDITALEGQKEGANTILMREDPFGNSGGLFCSVLKPEDSGKIEEKFDLLHEDFENRFSKDDLP